MYKLRIQCYRVASNRAGEAERKWRRWRDEILPVLLDHPCKKKRAGAFSRDHEDYL
jgi:hypothetical protein